MSTLNPVFQKEHKAFSADKLGEIVKIQLKENMLLLATDLSSKQVLLDYMDMVSSDPAVKIILLHSSPNKKGREEYIEFYNKIKNAQLDRGSLLRLCNAVNQIVLKLVESDKMIVHVNSGLVIMMFMNISLACDYRIVSEDTVFQNPCLDFGLIPKGGGAYFLSRRLGPGKSYEILLSCRDMTADEALEAGLVDMIVPRESLEEKALETAYRFSQLPGSSLTGIKRLINFSYHDLRDFLEVENMELTRILGSSMGSW